MAALNQVLNRTPQPTPVQPATRKPWWPDTLRAQPRTARSTSQSHAARRRRSKGVNRQTQLSGQAARSTKDRAVPPARDVVLDGPSVPRRSPADSAGNANGQKGNSVCRPTGPVVTAGRRRRDGNIRGSSQSAWSAIGDLSHVPGAPDAKPGRSAAQRRLPWPWSSSASRAGSGRSRPQGLGAPVRTRLQPSHRDGAMGVLRRKKTCGLGAFYWLGSALRDPISCGPRSGPGPQWTLEPGVGRAPRQRTPTPRRVRA
jgi:hypothetical protein